MKAWTIVILLLIGSSASAFTWRDLWKTDDQQAQVLMNKGQYKKAKEQFQQPDWRGAAAYKSGDYQQAASLFGSLNSESGFYNQGNALAHLGEYEQAIKAYDDALRINSGNQNAIFNRKLVENLLKKDQQQNQDKQGNDQQDQQNQNQQGNNQQNQQNQNQQGNDQQNQQNQNQQSKDQQNQQDKQQQSQEADNEQSKEKQSKAKEDEKNQQSQADLSTNNTEKQQAKEQWLRLIPDDPGGLMREKFLRDHLKRQRGWYQ